MAQRKLPTWMMKNIPDMKEHDTIDCGRKSKTCHAEKIVHDVPFLEYDGQLVYCYQAQECNSHCEDILENSTIVGFDVEWKVTYEVGVYKKTATLQLCTGERKCYVFQIIHMTSFPIELKRLLESESLKKVGVGIKGDVSRLYVDYNIEMNGIIDLALLANEKLGNNEKWSLNNLLLNQANKQLNKNNVLRCSDWEKLPLTADQLRYAALDAYAGWYLYQVLVSK